MRENELTLIFFDLETTGLNPDSDEVIEIGAIKVRDGNIIGKFHSFVRPHRNIPSLVTNLTGITFEDVENAPSPDDIRNKLEKFIGNYPLIAHNVSFDRIFLEKFMGKRLDNEFFDTLELSRIFFPHFSSHSLQNLVKTLSLKKEEAHRAVSDALMLYYLFERIVLQRKNSSPYLLHNIKRISNGIRNYEFIFGDNWEKSELEEESFEWETKRNEQQSGESLALPFNEDFKEEKELFKKYFEGNSYIELMHYDDFLLKTVKYALDNTIIISLYSPLLREKIETMAKKFGVKTYSFPNSNRFICPKKIDYLLSHPDLIPDNLKMNFATLFSYIYNTRDFNLEHAPTHVVKNPLLRLLSFCDVPFDQCEYRNVCPLYDAVKKARSSNLLIVNHSFFFNGINLKYDFLNRDTVFLEAYRLIKAFYSAKIGFSMNDFLFFATYYGFDDFSIHRIKEAFRALDEKRIGDDVTSIAMQLKNLFSNVENPLLSDFFAKEYFWLEKRVNNPIIFTSNVKVKNMFSKINSTLKNSLFVLPSLGIDGKGNVLMDFSGINGKEILRTAKSDKKHLSIVPTYLHSPNREEFVAEFSRLFNKVHIKGNKAVMFFSSNEIMKKVYFLLKREGKNVKAKGIDLKGEKSEIELYLYDAPILPHNAREIYFIRLPNISSIFYNSNLFTLYSSFVLKNIALDVLNPDLNSVVFYFDGRFKTPSFRTKYEDVFVTFPIFIDREDSLLTILSNWEKRNA